MIISVENSAHPTGGHDVIIKCRNRWGARCTRALLRKSDTFKVHDSVIASSTWEGICPYMHISYGGEGDLRGVLEDITQAILVDA